MKATRPTGPVPTRRRDAAWRRVIRALSRSERGGVAMIAATAIPAIFLIAVGAIQMQSIYSLKKRTQDLADSAALWGAQQLTITPAGAVTRTQAWARTQLPAEATSQSPGVTASEINPSTMKVAIDINVQGFFANLIPPGGFNIHSESTAIGSSVEPLCVLVTAPVSGDGLTLAGSSEMQTSCLVQSDASISVAGTAHLVAGAADAVTTASGPITPTALTGGQTKADPFKNLNPTSSQSCAAVSHVGLPITNLTTFPAGVPICTDINIPGNVTLTLSGGPYYFGGVVNVNGNATLNLNGGDYYFGGTVTVSGNGNIVGNDAVLDFENGAQLQLNGSANVSISGRQSGPLAGFALIVDPTSTTTFQLQSDWISKMTGTVYSPAAVLTITGSAKGLQASDWTVIAARSLQLTGSPDVVINSNYSGSSVPVPNGVGSNAGGGIHLQN